MKKSNLFTLSAAALMLFTACSQQEDMPNPGNESVVSFTVSTDGKTGSRSFADGKTALKLQYAVYESGSTTPVISVLDGDPGQVSFAAGALSTTVNLKLVNGKNYDILFWADSEEAPYTFNASTQTVTIDYTTMPAVNDETRDAFYKMETTGVISGPISKTVVLKRPFAQVNLGTDDLDAQTVKNAYGENAEKLLTSVKVKAYSSLNLATKAVDGETELTFTPGVIPSGEKFPVENYEYLSMNYLLVPQTQSSVADFTFTCAVSDGSSSHDFDVTNVPLQANYRTNIYGSLLTNPAAYTVTKDPIFETPDFNREVTAKTPEDFTAALVSPAIEKIKVESVLNLSDLTATQLTFASDKTIEMNEEAVLILPAVNNLEAINCDLTINGGRVANVDADGNPLAVSRADGADPMKGVAKKLIHIRNGALTLNNVELVNDMNHHWHAPTTYNSAAIAYWGNCEINIENCRVYSGMFALCGMGRGGANTSKVHLKDSYFESSSSNKYGTGNWAYCIRLFGSEGLIENCEVKGIQGGVSPEEGTFTFRGGKYYTVNSEEGRKDAFYALYATNKAKVIIEDGDFYSPNDWSGLAIEGTSCVVSGDNDSGMPLGTFVEIKGGRFSGKAYVGKRICDEFNWAPITVADNPLLKWTVSAAN